METVLRDVRYGLRTLAAAPGFTATAVVSLGLGIGAATGMFSALKGIVLQPPPYAEPRQLVVLWEAKPQEGLSHEPVSPVNFVDYRAASDVFADAAAWWRPEVNLSDDHGEPMRVGTVETSGNLFAVLGVAPLLGPGFPDGPLHADVSEVVISHRLWRTRFGEDRSVLGRSVRLNGQPFTVVGVMPVGFHFPAETDVWQRLQWDLGQHNRAAHFMEAVARLAPGASLASAQAVLDGLSGRLRRDFPATNKGWSVRAVPLQHEIAGFFRPALFVLFATVGVLLLMACLNVANLMLARAGAREREVAIRAAMGASRARLARQLLTESLMLASMSAGLGVALAWGGLALLRASPPLDIPRLGEVVMDARVLTFAIGLTFATAVLFGLAPALGLARPDLQRTLKEGARGTSTAPGRRRAGSALVVAQFALALTLLMGAGLLIRSLQRLVQQVPGFQSAGVLTANLELPGSEYPDWPRVARFYSDLVETIRHQPGVASASAANFLPLSVGWRIPFELPGRPESAPGDRPIAQHHSVGEDYFDTLGIPLRAGRSFGAGDTVESQAVVVINEALANRYFAGQDPVGRTLHSSARVIGPLGRWLMTGPERLVIGVVGDVRNDSLARAPEPAVYHSQRQFPFRNMNLLVRGASPAALAHALREAVRQTDASLPLAGLRPLDDLLEDSLARARFLSGLMAAFAALALLLAAVGIYGILAYTVSQRRQELSIRMALGATRAHVLWRIARHGMALALAGGALGAVGAWAFGRSLGSLLFDAGTGHLGTFAACLAVLLIVAAVACVLPARRGAALDPVAGLRSE